MIRPFTFDEKKYYGILTLYHNNVEEENETKIIVLYKNTLKSYRKHKTNVEVLLEKTLFMLNILIH